MSFTAYHNYQSTGVRWLPVIPSQWDILQGRRIFANRRESSRVGDEQLAASQLYGVIPQSLMMKMNDSKVMLALKGTSSFRHVEEGDFVISLRSFEGGVEYSASTGCVSPAYTVLKAQKSISSHYYRYLLKSGPFISALQSTTDSLRDGKAISYSQFGALMLSFPPLEEQTQIAAYLDYETARIDALIEKQEQLIALLKEKRQAVISHAVTKGLNPDAPMRDSGVEWLGELPEHWDLKPLKFIGDIISGFAFKGDSFTDSGVRVLKIANIQTYTLDWSDESFVPESYYERHKEFAVHDGDIVFALTRPIVSSGLKAAVANVQDELVLLNQRNAIFRPDGDLDRSFFYHVLFSASFRIDFQNKIDFTGQQPNISPLDITDIKIPFPPSDEQQAIADHLDQEIATISKVISKAKSAVVLLKERRTALISAAVTGKIDVRNWKAPKQEPKVEVA